MAATFLAGTSHVDWTPDKSVYLVGYPHVKRDSTGTNDPLLASALCLSDGKATVALIAVDVLFITHAMTRRIRQCLHETLGFKPEQVLIAATHTHSGPKTTQSITDANDPSVPDVDEATVRRCEDAVIEAVRLAHDAMVEAEAAIVVAEVEGIGGNRRNPDGPTDSQVPLLALRRASDQHLLGAMLSYGMHPTVMHEDSTLISGDFPAYTRQYLQKKWLGEETPVVYMTGVAGNQSPRHFTRGNTFEEAQRLGELLGEQVLDATGDLDWRSDWPISSQSIYLELPVRQMPSVQEAEKRLAASIERLASLREQKAPRTQVRTAEVDWFGAERTVTLANAVVKGTMQEAVDKRNPIEVQFVTIGAWTFIAWPGEVFVEFPLRVKSQFPNVHLIGYANGETGGYLVTREALEEGGYESASAIFQSPDSGELLVQATLSQLEKIATERAIQ